MAIQGSDLEWERRGTIILLGDLPGCLCFVGGAEERARPAKILQTVPMDDNIAKSCGDALCKFNILPDL